MSGIYGVVAFDGHDVGDEFRRVGDALNHGFARGSGTLALAPSIRLGVHYPQRPDLRPICSLAQAGRIAVAMAGWVHLGSPSQTRLACAGGDAGGTAADAAIEAYCRDGVAGITSLRGEFTAAVVDLDEGCCHVVTDRCALYPHFIAVAGGWLVFAPEMRALLEVPAIPRRLDRVALAQYLRFQQILGTRTWLEDVEALGPASVVSVDFVTRRRTSRRYWDWSAIVPGRHLDVREAADESLARLQRAVDLRSGSPSRTGIFLSGGLDGRLLLACVADRRPTTTLTFGAPECRDVAFAERIARRAGTDHHWFPLVGGAWVLEHAGRHLALTEGMHGWLHMHGITMLGEASRLVDANLTGWEGGLVFRRRFAGNRLDLGLAGAKGATEAGLRLFEAFCHQITWPGLTDDDAALLVSSSPLGRLDGLARDSFLAEWDAVRHYPPGRRGEYFYLDHHVLRSTRSMVVVARSALNVHCPYFDDELVTFMYGLPDEMRSDPNLVRFVLTTRMPRLARIPYEADLRLPHSGALLRESHAVLSRAVGWMGRHVTRARRNRPRLYADYEEYLRTDLREWADGLLFGKQAEARGLFNARAVRRLWDRHLIGRQLWTIGSIAPLMTIEQVCRYLIDGEPAEAAAGVVGLRGQALR